MRKIIVTMIVCLLSVLCGLTAPAKAQEAQAEEVPLQFKVRGAYNYQDLSFTSNAHGANFLFTADRPRKWGARAGFHYVDKFGDSAPGYDIGGTWWARKTTILSLDAEFAPKQLVIPKQAYTVGVEQILFKVLVPSLGYKFADYRTANAHIVMPGVTWYFYPRFDWMAKYFLSVSQFSGADFTNHSVMTRVTWNVVDPATLFVGYARANESFESGSVFNPFGGFSANHLFAGGKWEFYKGLGVDASFDYENRNNGTTLKTYESAVFYRW